MYEFGEDFYQALGCNAEARSHFLKIESQYTVEIVSM